MLLITTSTFLLLLAEGEAHATPWWDYPGLELWKFVNLFLFVGLMVYLLRHPLSAALVARRESIKSQLITAQQERDAAVNKLAEVQARLGKLESEAALIQEKSKSEAEAELERIRKETEQEIKRLQEQAQREIEGAGKVARHDLRRFAAQQSVQLAEELIRRDIKSEDDARLIKLNVEQLGRM
ncbi:MAG TPA: ATP synthase F0 subunit B [Pyrinomonadaceae bacterium]|nr:ATP synthase F0 subunit B [Pyrinomonadaceae bacterium]